MHSARSRHRTLLASALRTNGFGAAVVTYALYHEDQHAKAAAAFYERIRSERSKLARTTTSIATPPELERAAREVMAGRSEPQAALRAVLRDFNARSSSHLVGVVLEVEATGQLSLPPSLVEPATLGCAVVVTHAKKPGAAWGEWVIFVVHTAD